MLSVIVESPNNVTISGGQFWKHLLTETKAGANKLLEQKYFTMFYLTPLLSAKKRNEMYAIYP